MPKNKKKKSVRLVSHIKPERYNLTLKPDLEAFTFSGKEIIDILIDKPIKEITLHSKDIKIDTVEVIQGLPAQASKDIQFAQKISYDTKSETVTFLFKQPIKKGKAKLSIIFEGIINNTLRGFYRSRYVIDGETKHLATTQFEATDARRCFPCFDEPAQKAIFDVSLIIPGSHTAISNTMPTSIKEHEAGYKVIEFASTPRMSTYLLAFIIGEFEYVEGWTNSKLAKSETNLSGPRVGSPDHEKSLSDSARTQVRVFTTAGKKHQAKFALDVAIRSLEFYNKYFDIPYPLPVLDLIAIPDFESAAMENWGAVTFRETAILVDEKNSSLSNKQWVAIVIAHEIAHQWFGNLVTMEWWTDLWLNEGFASYMENLCTDHMFPEWHVWDLYLADRYASALRLDSLANSHPIEVIVHHPDEIGEIFDMVSYAKGSAVIRQLAEYLGHDKFRDGLRHYLKKHSYKNTNTIDLWNSFEKISKKPVKKIMNSWTKKTGYPLVTISKKKNIYIAAQERFFSSRVSKKNLQAGRKEKTIWQIPFKYESNTESFRVLTTQKSIPLIGTSIGKVNKGEGSFMRTRYDKATLERLKDEIRDGVLGVQDRLGLIRDLFALAEGGYIPTTEALEFSLAYKNEKEYIVWSEMASGINRVYNIIASGSPSDELKEKYRNYARSLFSPLAESMTFEKKKGENHSDTFLRNLALSHAAMYGDKNIINKAKKLFADRNKNPIPANIRTVVYNIVAQNGGTKEYEQFKNLFLKEELHEEKDRYGRALTSFKDKTLLAKTLMFTISKDVRTQDAPFLIGAIWQNTQGRDLTWKFIKHNWDLILKNYGGHFLSRLLSPLGTHTKIKDAIDAKRFFKKNNAPGADRTLEQAYERIYSNAAWLKDDKQKIQKWLKKNFS
jgi:puromycin-sensitive aminopeptidase